MPYATQQDLIARFGETELIQLSDRANTGAIDSVVVAAKLDDAEAEVNSYLIGRYTLPLDPVPVALQRIACDLARYHLYDDRPTEYVAKRYTDAIRFLEQVSKGTIKLGVDDGTPPPASTDVPEFETDGRTFTRDSLKGF